MLKTIYWGILLLLFHGLLQAKPFTDNGNSSVTDQKTGLVWQQTTASSRNWESALSYCESLVLANQSDWRLPNIKDLGSIADLSTYDPAIDTTAFPGTESSFYWSSTAYLRSASGAWRIHFYYGVVEGYNLGGIHYVRCVRGGQ